MKKSHIFLIVLCFLLIAVTLTSCLNEHGKGTLGDFNSLYSLSNMKKPSVTESIALPETINLPYRESKGDLLYFYDVEETGEDSASASLIVYDVKKQKIIYEKSELASRIQIESYELVTFTENGFALFDGQTCLLIDGAGKTYKTIENIGSLKDEVDYISKLIVLDDMAYKLEDGQYTDAFSVAGLGTQVHFDVNSDNFYYEIADDCVNIRDSKLNPYYTYQLPYEAQGSIYYLAKDVLVAQYVLELPDDAESYDYHAKNAATGRMTKYDLHTVLIDVQDKSEKEIRFNYLIRNILSYEMRDEDDWANSGVKKDAFEALVFFLPIDDQRLCNPQMYAVDSEMKLIREVNSYFDFEIHSIIPLNHKAYLVVLEHYNMAYIVDGQGQIVMAVDEEVLAATDRYVVTEYGIYNYAGKCIHKLRESDDRQFVTALGDNLYYQDSQGRFYEFVETSTAGIVALTSENGDNLYSYNFDDARFGFYIITETTRGSDSVNYRYVNANKDTVYYGSEKLKKATVTENGVLLAKEIRDGGNNTYRYYLFTAK